MGQKMASTIINDVTSKASSDTESAGIDAVVKAMNDGNAAAIRANAEGVGGSMIMNIIIGVMVIGAAGAAYKASQSGGSEGGSGVDI